MKDKFEQLYFDIELTTSEVGKAFSHSRHWVVDEARRRNYPIVRKSGARVGKTKDKPYTEEQLKQFGEDYQRLPREELTAKYNRTWMSIREWACEFGLKRGNAELRIAEQDIPAELPSYDEVIETTKYESNLFRAQIYPSMNVEATIKTKLPIALVFSADWHLGNLGVDYTAFDKDINTIANTPGVFIYIGGDGSENFIRVLGVPSAAGVNQEAIVVQRALFTGAVEKLKDKVVALGTGNHTDWERVATGSDSLADLARRLKLVYTQAGGMLKLTVGEQVYKIFRVHKARFSSTFNLTHCVKRLWEFAPEDFDIGIAEHKHEADIEPFFRHGLERWAVRTGTYLIYDDYARRGGFFGSRVANPTIVLYPQERRMVGFLDTKEAIAYLGGV